MEMMTMRFRILILIALLGPGCSSPVGEEAPPASSGAPSTRILKPQAPATAAEKPAASGANPAVSSAIPDAITKALALPTDKERIAALKTAGAEWCRQSPIAAFSWSCGLPSAGYTRASVLDHIIITWVTLNSKDAVQYVLQLPNTDGNRRLALHYVAAAWARKDPPAAADWALSCAGADMSVIMSSVGEGWAQVDAPAAAHWSERLPAERSQYTIGWAAGSWSWKDPHAAAAWVQGLPPSDIRQKAANAVHSHWKTRIPAESAQADNWLRSLTPSTTPAPATGTKG